MPAVGTRTGERVGRAGDGAGVAVELVLGGGRNGSGPQRVRLVPLPGRVRVELVLGVRGRGVDLSLRPAFLADAVAVGAGAGVAAGTGPEAEHVAHRVAEVAAVAGAWRPDDPGAAGVLATAGGAAFALLGAAIDGGAGPLREIPRWAAPALVPSSARAGAEAAFGAALVTRPVVGAFARALVPRTGAPDGSAAAHPANLYPLALGLLGAGVLDPDRLARLLGAAAEHPVAPELWPDVDGLDRGRHLVPLLGAHRAARVLTDAATDPAGPVLLADTLRLFALTRHHVPGRLPTRLRSLHDACVAALPADPHPERPAIDAVPARRHGRHGPRRSAVVGAAGDRPAVVVMPVDEPSVPVRPAVPERPGHLRARYAPTVDPANPPPRSSVPLVPAPRLADLDGSTAGDLRFVLPATTAVLEAWGHRLHNCLATYDRAVAAGASHLVGIERAGVLVYCLELHPDGWIRQLLGDRNRVPRPADVRVIVGHLRRLGLLDERRAANRPWLAT